MKVLKTLAPIPLLLAPLLIQVEASEAQINSGLFSGVGFTNTEFGNAGSHYQNEENGSLYASSSFGGSHVITHIPFGSNQDSLLIVGPKIGEARLQRGFYQNASFLIHPTRPQFLIYTLNGACPLIGNTGTGSADFYVRHIRYEENEIASLVLDYRVRCNQNDDYFLGTVRINPEESQIDERSFLEATY